MKVSLIAAMAENRVIGCKGRLPWHIPQDLELFRRLTTGHTVIMGRRTFESIGRPLPRRTTVILSRDPLFRAEGCTVARSIEEALASAAADEEVFVCGGGEVYREALPLAVRIYLTIVHAPAEGDVLFPEIPEPEFEELDREPLDSSPPCTFVTLQRRSPPASP